MHKKQMGVASNEGRRGQSACQGCWRRGLFTCVLHASQGEVGVAFFLVSLATVGVATFMKWAWPFCCQFHLHKHNFCIQK